jgi:Big-like domain-containing protein
VNHSRNVWLPATISDDVARIDLIDASGTVLASATEAPWSFTRDLPAGSAGHISLMLRVYDKVGNKTTYQPNYAVDNQGPNVKVDWPYSDIPGVVAGGSAYYPYASAQDTAKVDHIEWWSAGALVRTGPSLVYDYGRTSRTVAFEVRAWDKLGNESITPVTVRIDATGPTITSLSPAPGAFVRGTYYHSYVKASDPSGIGWMTLNGAGIDTTPNSAVAVGKDGTRVWTWVVYDSFGNPSTARRTITVDNTKPSLKLTSAPKSGAKVKGTVPVKASASDHNGISRVELLINGKIVAKDTTPGYAFSINTKKYGKTFKVQIRAYDKAGNSSTTPTRTWHR